MTVDLVRSSSPELSPVSNRDTAPLLEPEQEGQVAEAPSTLELLLNEGWRFHADDDEASGTKKEKKERDPPGLKQYSVQLAGLGGIGGLSWLFQDRRIVTGSLSGSVMDFCKELYQKIPEGTRPKTVYRIIASICFLISMGLLGTQFALPNNSVLNFLNKAPFLDVPTAIFIKCDLCKLKPDRQLVELSKKCRFELSKTQAAIVTSAIQGGLAAGLAIQPYNIPLATIGGILFKSNMLDIIEKAWEEIDHIEDKTRQRKVLALVYSGVVAIGVPGIVLTQFSSNPLLNLGVIPPSTVISKTIKCWIKACKKEDGSQEEKWKTVAKTIAVLGLILGLSLLAGRQMESGNPAFMAVLCHEFFSFMKVGAKAILPEKVSLILSLTVVTLLSTLYTVFDDKQIPFSGSGLFVLVFFIQMVLYLLVPHLRGAEKEPLPILNPT